MDDKVEKKVQEAIPEGFYPGCGFLKMIPSPAPSLLSRPSAISSGFFPLAGLCRR
jgi:hypothetical protein